MARLRKQQAEEYVRVLYGIDYKTFKVESVYQTRGGSFVAWRNEIPIRHPLNGRTAETECVIVFGLTDVVGFPISLADTEHVNGVKERLREKAEAMKAEAEKAEDHEFWVLVDVADDFDANKAKRTDDAATKLFHICTKIVVLMNGG